MITFLLFINFLLRAIDRFLGKGLDVLTILEYLFLNLAWIIALSVPMAVLLSTLMTFGRLSEDNEINAMRASGISFLSIIRAPIIFGITVATLLVIFNNFILPDMNFHARLLSGDIYRKRPGMNIEPGVFLDNLPDYSMIVGGKNGELMSDVRIFSKGQQESQTSIHSKTGKLSTLSDAFLLTLFDGEIHEIENKDYANYRRIIFETHKIIIPADDILLNRRDSSNRTDREMTVPMIMDKVNSYEKKRRVVRTRLKGAFHRTLGDSLLPNSIEEGSAIVSNVSESICHSLQYYIDMINKKLSLTKGENLLIDNDNTQDDAQSNRRSISSELKSFWNENMIIIICKLIDELDKTEDEQDRDSIINSIESILDSKDRHLKTIVEKYSSTIV